MFRLFDRSVTRCRSPPGGVVLREWLASFSVGGMCPRGSRSRRWLNQSTYSRVAYPTWSVAHGLDAVAGESGPVVDPLLFSVAWHGWEVSQHREPGGPLHQCSDRGVPKSEGCRVGPGRPVSVSAGGFPRPALRTGRATSGASGSPCVHAFGVVTHRCSFVCITRTRRSASTGPGHGAPVFTSDLRDQHFCCEHTGPLRHVTGFPGLGLLRVLRPIPAASAGNKPSRRPAGCWPVREPGGWFPRSVPNRSTGSASSYAPATSPRLRRRPSPWPPESTT